MTVATGAVKSIGLQISGIGRLNGSLDIANHDDVVSDRISETSPSGHTARGHSIEVVIGFLTPYLLASLALVVNSHELDLGQLVWSFLLPILLMVFPLITIPYNLPGLAVVMLIAAAFYVIPRLLPAGYSRYAYGLVFLAWGVYGVRCVEWIPA